MSEMVYRCIGGSEVGEDGVCLEHGETACVIGVRTPSAPAQKARDDDDAERDESNSIPGQCQS
jgi:hypothetical protein